MPTISTVIQRIRRQKPQLFNKITHKPGGQTGEARLARCRQHTPRNPRTTTVARNFWNRVVA